MKNIKILFMVTACALMSCVDEGTYYGHWTCDETGTVKTYYNGVTMELPLTRFYDQFDMEKLEFEIVEDGDFIMYDLKKNDSTSGPYLKDYNGYGNKILTVIDKDTLELTFNSIRKNKMSLNLHAENDGMTLFMNVNRVN